MPSTHTPRLLQQALKPQLKSRFQKVVMDNKRGSRNKNGIISHDGFSAFVSANGQREQFQPHRKVRLLLTILLEWEQRQRSPLVDELEPGGRSEQVMGEYLHAAGRAVAAFPSAWFLWPVPFCL